MAQFAMKRHGKGIGLGMFDGSAHRIRAVDLWGTLDWSQNFDRAYAAAFFASQPQGNWLRGEPCPRQRRGFVSEMQRQLSTFPMRPHCCFVLLVWVGSCVTVAFLRAIVPPSPRWRCPCQTI